MDLNTLLLLLDSTVRLATPLLLAPDNVRITLSAGLAVDTGEGVVLAGVEEMLLALDPQGRPVIQLDGFQVGIEEFNAGSYLDAVAEKNLAENITMVLYPNTATEGGHESAPPG